MVEHIPEEDGVASSSLALGTRVDTMKKLDPKFIWQLWFSSLFRLLITIFALGIPLAVVYFVLFSTKNTFILRAFFLNVNHMLGSFAIVFLIASYIKARLVYKNYLYEFSDIGLKIESGVLNKKYVTIPYERIQNIDIYRSLISRVLGLSGLYVQTGGMNTISAGGSFASRAEGVLPGLDLLVANEVRDELLKKAEESRRKNGNR